MNRKDNYSSRQPSYPELTGRELGSLIYRSSCKLLAFWKGKKTIRGLKGLADLICRAAKPKGIKIIPVRAGKLALDFRDDVMAPELFATGVHEPTETDLWLRAIKPGQTVLDVGANVGYYTLLASKLVGDTGRVYSFEPEPENFRLLLENIRLNDCRNVQPIQKAISNKAGKSCLALNQSNLGAHHFANPSTVVKDGPCLSVDTMTLDQFVEQQHLQVDWIKMDIEGAEPLAVEGGQNTLRRDHPGFLMEFWHRGLTEMGGDPAMLLNTLQGFGYQFRAVCDGIDKGILEPSDIVAMARTHHPVNLLLTHESD